MQSLPLLLHRLDRGAPPGKPDTKGVRAGLDARGYELPG
jgi:hypothetical protein